MGSSLTKFIILDALALVILFVIMTWLGIGATPFKRGFFRGDHEIAFPHTKDADQIVPLPLLFFWTTVCPFIVFSIFWIFIDKIWSNSFDNMSVEAHSHLFEGSTENDYDDHSERALLTSSSIPGTIQKTQKSLKTQKPTLFNWGTVTFRSSTPRGRKLRFAAYQAMVFLFCLLVCLLVTNSLKLLVGRLRPDFLARCDPDYSYPGLVIDQETGYIAGEWVDKICRGDKKVVIEGRKSYPSGHSSSAMLASAYIAIYVAKRFWHRGRRNFGSYFTPTVCIISILIALLIGASRVSDYWHNPTDVFFGLMIGGASALISLIFDPFTPSYEEDGSICAKNQLLAQNNPESDRDIEQGVNSERISYFDEDTPLSPSAR